MSSKRGSEIPWWLIVLGFMVWAPLGFVLLFLNLSGARIPTERIRQEADHFTAQRRKTPTVKAPKKSKLSSWTQKIRQGRLMSILGGLMGFGGLMGLTEELPFAIKYGLLDYASYWVPLVGLLCAGLFMVFTGMSRVKTTKRQRLYMGIIGQRSSISLADLAGAAGVSVKKATSDLQDMLANGLLPMGYIDRLAGRLVLTDEGYQPPEAPQPTKAQPATE